MINRTTLGVMWLVFALIFASLGWFHWHAAGQSAPEFVLPVRPGYAQGMSVQIAGMDVDQPIKDFTKTFNEYVRSQNESSTKQNIASALGYLIAFVTALISALVELKPRRSQQDFI